MTAASVVITSVFTLHDPTDQATLFDLLTTNAVEVFQQAPGFVTSVLSRSDDGTTIINHAQWRDEYSARAMLSTPGAQESMQRTRALAGVTVVRATTNRTFLGHSA